MEKAENKILEKIKAKDYVKRFAVLSFALFFAAINYNLFILPIGVVTGGTSGIATITKEMFNLDPSMIIFLLSFLVLIFSYLFLDKDDTVAAGFITIIYPLFIKATEGFSEIFLINYDEKLLVSIFAGVISGITNGIIYKTGLNTGGLGVISKIIGNKCKTSVAKVNFIINMLIVVLGSFVFGVNMIFYAGVILYINKIISERVLLGKSSNKMFYIISNKYREITNYFIDKLHHDVTVFNVKGKFSDKDKKNIMIIVPTFQYYLVKEEISKIDRKAFVTVTDNYEVKGQDIKINSVKSSKKNWLSRIFPDKML